MYQARSPVARHGGRVRTIGTPDRSSHEFLHGENNSGNPGSCPGCDGREYFGNWNCCSDFAANNGSVVYFATAVGSAPAINNAPLWNYTQWNQFNPGLFAESSTHPMTPPKAINTSSRVMSPRSPAPAERSYVRLIRWVGIYLE